MRPTKTSAGKREQVTQDIQGIGKQEPDRNNQLASKNQVKLSEDMKDKTGKTASDKGKQQRKMSNKDSEGQ